MRTELTEAQVDDACLSFRHDFGLLNDEEKNVIRQEAREWIRAWDKTLEFDEIKDYANAMAEILKDFLPLCPAKKIKMVTMALEKGRHLVCNINEENIRLKEELDSLKEKSE